MVDGAIASVQPELEYIKITAKKIDCKRSTFQPRANNLPPLRANKQPSEPAAKRRSQRGKCELYSNLEHPGATTLFALFRLACLTGLFLFSSSSSPCLSVLLCASLCFSVLLCVPKWAHLIAVGSRDKQICILCAPSANRMGGTSDCERSGGKRAPQMAREPAFWTAVGNNHLSIHHRPVFSGLFSFFFFHFFHLQMGGKKKLSNNLPIGTNEPGSSGGC